MTKPIYERLAVVGCGLIGSSVIRAARDAGVVSEIIVADASETHRTRITELGLADRVTGDIAEAVAEADLVIFAVPVQAMGDAAQAAAATIRPGTTVSDVGSVKGSVAEALRAALKSAEFKSVAGPFKFNTNQFPIRNFYRVDVAKDASGQAVFVNKGVVLKDHADAYYKECKL